MTPDEISHVLNKMRRSLYELQVQLQEVTEEVSRLPWPPKEERICPECNQVFRSKLTRDEHVYHSHDGPVPEHYLAAERAAGLVDTPVRAVN